MKKSIVLIALALIMVASVFATAEKLPRDTKDTPVAITLEKESKYQYGIVSADTASVTKVTDTITNTKDTITLNRVAVTDSTSANYGKNILSTNTNYKIQYLFYEYDDVKLDVTVSGNMKYEKDGNVVDSIPFKLQVASANDKVVSGGETEKSTATSAVTINSNDTAAVNLTKTIISYDGTDLLGCARMADLAITVGPVGDETLDEKPMGKYTATITLQAVAK